MRRHTFLTALALAFSLMVGIQLVTLQVKANTIVANVNIDPDSLLLKENGNGKWITAYIELPEGYDVNDIDMSSVTLEITDIQETFSWSWYNIQGNVFMVKFDRESITNAIIWSPLIQHMSPRVKYELTMKITGNLSNGDTFEGTDRIKVFFTQEEMLFP